MCQQCSNERGTPNKRQRAKVDNSDVKPYQPATTNGTTGDNNDIKEGTNKITSKLSCPSHCYRSRQQHDKVV